MIELKLIDVPVFDGSGKEPTTEKKVVYVETITETREITWDLDQLESLVIQKKNNISNLETEIIELEKKMKEIKSLAK